jgi:hypothetical protein
MQGLTSHLAKRVPELTSDNWYEWSQLFGALMASQRLAHYLTTKPPAVDDENSAAQKSALEKYEIESEAVLNSIIMFVSAPWRTTLLQKGFTTAEAAYTWLKEENVTVLEHDRARLRRELSQLKMLPTESAGSYVDRARGLYDQLLLMDDTIYNPAALQMVLQHILQGLPASWNTTVLLLNSDMSRARQAGLPPRSILDIKGELVRTEAEQKDRPSAPELDSGTASAFAAFLATQRSGTPTGRSQKHCSDCRRNGHTTDECWTKYAREHQVTIEEARAALTGKPQRRANLAFTPAQTRMLRQFVASLPPDQGLPPAVARVSPEKWCIDSGTDAHMSPSREGLLNYQELHPPMKVLFAGNTEGDIMGIGTKHISTTKGKFTLKQVLHVPGLVGNLLSLADCWRQQIGVHFDPRNDIVTFVKEGKLVMTASFNNGLFYLNQEHHARAATVIGAGPLTHALHWHKALGHVSFTMLAHMKRENLLPPQCKVTPAEFLQAGLTTCEPCVRGKNTRDGRPTSLTPAPRTCYILHADLIVQPVSDMHGNTHTLCVIDGHTSMSVAIPIKLKSDAKYLIPDIIAMYERQSGQTVLNFRTDRGGEFMNEILKDFFRSKGIIHEFTGGYSSESNGKAERFNRTIMEKTRTMIKAAGLPDSYWGLAILMANQLHNCIPVNTKTNQVSPHEAFFKIKPNLSYLQPFGATAYVHVPKALRKKLDDHTVRGILVGYAEPSGSHTYIVRMPNGTHKHSRDVTFDSPGHVHTPDTYTAAADAPPEVTGLPEPMEGADSGSEYDDEYDADDVPADGSAPVQILDAPAQLPAPQPQLQPQPPAQLPAQLPVQLPVQLPAQLPAQLPPQLPPQLPAQLPVQLPAPAPPPVPDAQPAPPPAAGARQLPATQASERQPRLDRKRTQHFHAHRAQLTPASVPQRPAPPHAEPLADPPGEPPSTVPASPTPAPASRHTYPPHASLPSHLTSKQRHAQSGGTSRGAGKCPMVRPGMGKPRPLWSVRPGSAHSPEAEIRLEKALSSHLPARPPAPATYREATHPDRLDRELWIEAMQKEYNSLIGFGAWKLVPKADMPRDQRAIGCRWTYAIKADGRYKARLVAQGFLQRPGLDYDETYAPTSKLATLRTFLSVVASEDLECVQLDVATAFLHAPIDGEVYMRQPEGFTHNSDLLCRLLRALYGLKQSGRLWHLELRNKLLAHGFVQAESDPSMFILRSDTGTVLAVVYVDDCLIAGRTQAEVQNVVTLIQQLFTCVVLGEPKLFLGVEIARDRAARTLTISQGALVDSILAKYSHFGIKPRLVPMQPSRKLTKDGEPMDEPQELYGSLLGSIMYVSNGTRPDITYATNRLARYTQNPKRGHWEALLYLLGYLLRYPHVGITYGGERGVRVYSDADHAGDTDTSRSTGGYAVIVNGGMTSWRSKIQASVAKSTCEAEYRASNAAACEVLWYNKLLPELGQPLSKPININCDNQSAESLLKNPMSTEQSKYFRIFWHFGRDAQLRGELTFSYIKSARNVADPFTKALPGPQLMRLMALGGVHIKRPPRYPD